MKKIFAIVLLFCFLWALPLIASDMKAVSPLLKSGNDVWTADTSDKLAIGHTDPNASLDILIPSASTTGIMIKGADNQTGDYLQVKDPNDVELFVIEADGETITPAVKTPANKWKWDIVTTDLVLYYYDSGWTEHTRFSGPVGVTTWHIDDVQEHITGDITDFDYTIFYYAAATGWTEHTSFSRDATLASIKGIELWKRSIGNDLVIYYNENDAQWTTHSTFTKP